MAKHLPEIRYKTIKNKDQRYPTVGDYYLKDRVWEFRSSRLNFEMEACIFLHEFIEWCLTQQRGISEPSIAKFDKMFEKEREQGKWKDDEEPGFDRRSPYRKEHSFADKLEREFARELGLNWQEYTNEVNKL